MEVFHFLSTSYTYLSSKYTFSKSDSICKLNYEDLGGTHQLLTLYLTFGKYLNGIGNITMRYVGPKKKKRKKKTLYDIQTKIVVPED